MVWGKVVIGLVSYATVAYCQLDNCHDDPSYVAHQGTIEDLQFTWLGALQYIHIKSGKPHYFRVPRVVLVNRQFALSTAADAATVPDGYALGNIVFSEYERDEAECHVTVQEIAAGATCDPVVLLMPIADVLLHPEYKNFGVTSSVALLKLLIPVKSNYMLPVCLPLKNYIDEESSEVNILYHVDFSSAVPRNFMDEDKEVTMIQFLPKNICLELDGSNTVNATTSWARIVCSTGCDFHSGAPTIIHEHTGHWTVIALSEGRSECPDPLIPWQRSRPPPRHIMVRQYVEWINNAITGVSSIDLAKNNPFEFSLRRASPLNRVAYGWVGHWWMGGYRCYERGKYALELFRFYHESFEVKPFTETTMRYYLEIDPLSPIVVVCVKVGMPYVLGQPRVWGLHTGNVKVRIPLIKFHDKFRFEVEAWGYNRTDKTRDPPMYDEIIE